MSAELWSLGSLYPLWDRPEGAENTNQLFDDGSSIRKVSTVKLLIIAFPAAISDRPVARIFAFCSSHPQYLFDIAVS
jgi:hypothetical protein